VNRAADSSGRRAELAAFLRSRRDRLAPEAVGLPPAPRRRTPGLRREEVAQLAGVGITWYTWLEQGRPINASAEVFDALARALLLDRHERAHLFALAGYADRGGDQVPDAVPPAVRAVLDGLDPVPARVVNARWDVLGYNRAEAAVMGDYALRPPEERNILSSRRCASAYPRGAKTPRTCSRCSARRWPSTSANRRGATSWPRCRSARPTSGACGGATTSPGRARG